MSERGEKVDIEEETDNIVVVDPDDYQKTQKLKSIQEAKDHFKSFTTNEVEMFQKLDDTYGNPKQALKYRRGKALAMYASELMPLIEEAIVNDVLTEADLIVDTNPAVESAIGKSELGIREIIEFDGAVVVDGEKLDDIPEIHSKKVYRRLEAIERELGLGLELEENKGPAEI
jgi:hypothetical protein